MGAEKKKILEEHLYYGGPLDGGRVPIYDIKVLKNLGCLEVIWSVNLDGKQLQHPAVYMRGLKDSNSHAVHYNFVRYAERENEPS